MPSRPELLALAKSRALEWAQSGQSHAPYAREWLRILELPVPQLSAEITDRSQHARDLRQATPFAGAIGPRERWRMWKEVRDRWEAK